MSQTDFIQAVLDPAKAVPQGLSDPQGRPAGRRFAVYRNNVTVSLTEALETGFPVIRALVGDEFFKAMAGVYLRAHPPASPLMMYFGTRMPAFLTDFAPVQHLPYLPDVARLELALRESYHAADAEAAPADMLMALPPDRLAASSIVLAPALRLIRSSYPVYAIWLANTRPDAPRPQVRAEDALITRPAFDPQVHLLPPGGGTFVAALQSGQTLGQAMDRAQAEFQDFSLTDTLGLLLAGNAIFDVTPEERP